MHAVALQDMTALLFKSFSSPSPAFFPFARSESEKLHMFSDFKTNTHLHTYDYRQEP